MSYESPVTIFESMNDMIAQIEKQREDQIVAHIAQHIGIEVNKDELMKALINDRHQYEAGYSDGRMRGYNEGRDSAILSLAESLIMEYGDKAESIALAERIIERYKRDESEELEE